MPLIRHSIARKTVAVTLLLFGMAVGVFVAARHGMLPQALLTPELILWILVTCFVGLFVFVLLHVIRPLQRITAQLALLERGDIREVTHDSTDELGQLVRFFNTTVRAIGQVSADITDRQRLSDELAFTGKVQQHLLPKKMPIVPGLDVVVKTRSATEVGGDNFDIIARDGETLFYVGDATGHGFPAGLIMSMVNVLVHAAAQLHETPPQILAAVNKALQPKLMSTMFMTLVMLRYAHDSKKIFFTGCGHEHILVYRAATQTCEHIKTGGIAIGMIPDVERMLRETEIALADGDAIVLFTDGITEASNRHGEMFGLTRLSEAVAKSGGKEHAEYIFNAVSRRFNEFVGADFHQSDDTTLLVMKRMRGGHLDLEVDTSGIEKSRPPNWSWDA